jgi:hypothetical protein
MHVEGEGAMGKIIMPGARHRDGMGSNKDNRLSKPEVTT